MSSDTEDTFVQIQTIARLVRNIPLEDVDALVAEFQRMESIMPILDPTGWMRIANNVSGHQELVLAFVRFRRTVEVLARPA
jgi:hypothetical protein